jgi:uncharacterized protein (TIGR00299 family) protein
MRTLFLDCGMGAAGDMLSAALLELTDDPEKTLAELNALGIPGVEYSAEKTEKCGVVGTRLHVTFMGDEEGRDEEHHHHHGRPSDIEAVIAGLNMPETAKTDAREIYALIAGAEAEVHGKTLADIHFHELGTMDAVADVAAASFLIDRLAPERIVCSPVRTGYGRVKCAHGILPVPAPAAAVLLKGVPVYAGDIEGEMCTPTGAAVLKHFAGEFRHMPEMTVDRIGCGMGGRDFAEANCVRALLGESGEYVAELCCNVDDMTPESVGYAMETLKNAGALDVYWSAIGMKKCRPGVELSVLCRDEDRDRMVRLIFRHTTTIGIRETLCSRFVLKRRSGTANTPWGPVRVKTSEGYGVTRRKPEYDDMAEIADKNGLSLDDVRKFTTGGNDNA